MFLFDLSWCEAQYDTYNLKCKRDTKVAFDCACGTEISVLF